MNARERLKQAARELRQAGVPDPETDSAQLLSRVTGRPPLELRLGFEIPVLPRQEEQFRALLERRKTREPLQYLMGSVQFCGAEVRIRPGVLIPRPETELLAEWAAEEMRGREAPEILDLCCGSGCLGISLGRMLPAARVTMTDLSPEAEALARENSEGLRNAEVLRGDLFAPVRGRRFDLIVSNPPYIPAGECGTLQEEVLREPRMALDGGADGLDFYRRIAAEAPGHLKRRGLLMTEVGAGEAEPAAEMFRANGAARTEIRKDLAGIGRMVLAAYGAPAEDGAEEACLKS